MDVGANTGQSLEAALLYPFDTIYCFEPVKKFYSELTKVARNNFKGSVIFNNFGLYNDHKRLPIYGPVDGPDGYAASIYSDHQDVKDGIEMCTFLDVNDWMRTNLSYGDAVIMKLNCEGAEVDIVNRLLDTNIFRYMANVMIDFDAVKIPSKKAEVAPLMTRLKPFKNYVLAEQVMHGATHKDRICNWLNKLGLKQNEQVAKS